MTMTDIFAVQIAKEVEKDFPCRVSQTTQLVGCLSQGGVHLIQGPASTGKTGILKTILSGLSIPHAYVSLAVEQTPARLVESALHQLGVPLPEKIKAAHTTGAKRKAVHQITREDEDEAAAVPVVNAGSGPGALGEDEAAVLDDQEDEAASRVRAKNLYLSECLHALESFLQRGRPGPVEEDAPTTLAAPPAKKGTRKTGGAAVGSQAPPLLVQQALVLDDLDLLSMLGEAATQRMEETINAIVSLVSNFPDHQRTRTALFIIVRGAITSNLVLGHLGDIDQTVFFDNYTAQEVETILMRDAEGRPGYKNAIALALQITNRQTENLRLLRRHVHTAYETERARCNGKVVEGAVFSTSIKKTLTDLKADQGRPDIRYRSLTSQVGQDEEGAGPGPSSGIRKDAASGAADQTKGIAGAEGVDLQGIPSLGKFLLLAGYIASRNEKSLDADLFNIGKNKFKRNRKSSKGVSTADVLDMKRREAYNKAPSLFSLERLLAIYWRMYENEGIKQSELPEDEEELERELLEERRLALSCTIMHELATLERNRLLQRVDMTDASSALLKGTSELRCNLPEAAAEQLAEALKINLKQYVLFTN